MVQLLRTFSEGLTGSFLDFISMNSFCDLQIERRARIQLWKGPGDPLPNKKVPL
jgi:hypothetical protein